MSRGPAGTNAHPQREYSALTRRQQTSVLKEPIRSSSEHFHDRVVFLITVKRKWTRRKEKVTLEKMLMRTDKFG